MQLTKDDAERILFLPKRLIELHRWESVDNRTGCSAPMSFAARVLINGAMPRGLWFRAKFNPTYPDGATLQLDCEQPDVRAHIPLFRVEWRPFKAHRNGPYGPKELRNHFIEAGLSHVHSCLDHIDDATGLILPGGVQTARILESDFNTFSEALSWTCDKINILNPGDIPPPPAQSEMF